MNNHAEEAPRTQTEFTGDGNGRPPRPTTAGLGESGGQSHVPDISTLKKYKGVLGSLVIGHDGALIASDFQIDVEEESIGVWALGVFMNTEHVVKKMGQSCAESRSSFLTDTTSYRIVRLIYQSVLAIEVRS